MNFYGQKMYTLNVYVGYKCKNSLADRVARTLRSSTREKKARLRLQLLHDVPNAERARFLIFFSAQNRRDFGAEN